MNNIFLSQNKINELKKEIESITKAVKQDQSFQLKRGGAMDSFHETASFAATEKAKEKKLSELKDIVKYAQILPERTNSKTIKIGSYVNLKEESGPTIKYRVVHPLEANPSNNLISTR